MKLSDLILRCYVEREADGTWFAMCIDLNLYARAESDHAVKQKMHGFIKEYISEALTKDVDYVGDLIPRRAPWPFRLKYHWIALQCAFHDATRDRTHSRFNEHLPVVPA